MDNAGTPWQCNVAALLELLRGARDELNPDEYSWFVAAATEAIGLEAARLFAGEASRARRRATPEGQLTLTVRSGRCPCGARQPQQCAYERARRETPETRPSFRRPHDCLDHPQDQPLPEDF
jgi:hypothetical protein